MTVRRPMRIALTGSHGTGKTTLANALLGYSGTLGLRAILVPEVPRIVCATTGDPEFFRRGRNSLLRQLTLLLGQPVFERKAEGAHCDVVICDRTLLDHWAYTIALFGESLSNEGLAAVLGQFVSSYMSTYDLIAYLPIEFAPVDDGTREGDTSFQSDVDRQIHSLLLEYAVPHLTLTGTVEDRLRGLQASLPTREEQPHGA